MTNRYKNKRLRYAQNKERSTFNWDTAINYALNTTRWTRRQRISLFFQEIRDRKAMSYETPYKGPSKVYKESDILFYDPWAAY